MSNVYHKLYYHLVWSTKNREVFITPAVEELIKYYIPKKIVEHNGISLAFNNTEDHIHLLCHIPPKISISEFVNKIKGSSSHYVNISSDNECLYWQNGYSIFSLSEKNIPFVRKYIINQKQHHRDNTLIDILEKISDDQLS